MQQTILLNTTENTKQVEREEQGHFVRAVLSAFVGPSIDDIWIDEELTTEQHMQLRKLLLTNNIEVVDDFDGGVKIHCFDKNSKQYHLIGEFKKPHYRLKKDPGQVNPSRKQYLEMTIDTWSVLDEPKDE